MKKHLKPGLFHSQPGCDEDGMGLFFPCVTELDAIEPLSAVSIVSPLLVKGDSLPGEVVSK